jgi:hypothetical protein
MVDEPGKQGGVSSPRQDVPVDQFRDSIGAMRDAMASRASAISDQERQTADQHVHRLASELASSTSRRASQVDIDRANDMLERAAQETGWQGERIAGADKQPWQMSPEEFMAQRYPEIEKMRGSGGTGGRDLPRKVTDALREHKQFVEAAVARGDQVDPRTLERHGITTQAAPFKSDPEWNGERFAMDLSKGHGFWQNGQPIKWTSAKDSGDSSKAASYLKEHGGDEVSVQFQHHGDDRLNKRYVERVKKIAEAAGYEAGEPVTREQGGHKFNGHTVVTLRKKPSSNVQTKALSSDPASFADLRRELGHDDGATGV